MLNGNSSTKALRLSQIPGAISSFELEAKIVTIGKVQLKMHIKIRVRINGAIWIWQETNNTYS